MALPTASDNPYPSLLIVEGTEPSAPSAGRQRVYIDSTSHHLKRTDSSGTDVDIENAVGTFTAPAVRAVGTSATGTGNVTPGLPTGHTTNDILLLFVQSNNQTAAAPAGYAQVGPAAGIGTAAAAGGTRLTVFWKRDGGAESDPTVLDTGDHTLAQILAVSGCVTTGDPFLNVGASRKATASTTSTGSAGATPVDQCMVVQAFVTALDSASAAFSSPTNADLSSVTEQIDVATADGNGGGIGVITGIAATSKSFAATTATVTSTADAGLAFILLPASILGRQGFVDRQVFLTPGLADTWTKPTGAKHISIVGMGGGASGSAGRNAATAAGGGGGGGGAYRQDTFGAAQLPATLTVTAGAGGAATANTDGAASNAGSASSVASGGLRFFVVVGGFAAGVSATGSGGLGGNGGGLGTAGAVGAFVYGSQPAGGGTGGTTAAAGATNVDFGGGAGAGGGTSQAASAGGNPYRAAGGGGGGRSNTNVGTGGAGGDSLNVGGATAGAAGTDSPYPEAGGGGGAGGTSAAGPGGAGGWPGGGGGGGGSQSGAQRGGAGGDGVVVIVTLC